MLSRGLLLLLLLLLVVVVVLRLLLLLRRRRCCLHRDGVASLCEWMLLQVSSSFFSCYAPGLLVRLFAQRPNAQPVRAAAVARLSALAVGMWKPAMSATA